VVTETESVVRSQTLYQASVW